MIEVIPTDAPVDARNLKRMAAKAMLGTGWHGRCGLKRQRGLCACVGPRPRCAYARRTSHLPGNIEVLPNDAMSPLFLAVIEATEEAVYNSLLRATRSPDGDTVEALPIDQTVVILRKYGAIK